MKTKFNDQPDPKSILTLPNEEWGWAVIAATFFIRLTVPSLKVSFSIVYLMLTHKECMTNLEASFIMALFVGVFSITSPFSTSLCMYYSHRKLVFIGVLLMSAGLALCSLSLSLPWLLVCYGVLGGLGCSLVTSSSFLVTQKYHNKKRIIANIMASLGSSLSFLVMPLFIYFLILHLTLRGAFLIWSSIILNCLVGAMFYRRPVAESIKMEATEPTELPEIRPLSSQESISYPLDQDECKREDSELGEEQPTPSKRSEIKSVEFAEEDCEGAPLKRVDIKSVEFAEEDWESVPSKRSEIKSVELSEEDWESVKSENGSMKSLPQFSEFVDCRNEPTLDRQRRFSFLSTAVSVESFKTSKSIYMSMENTFASLEYMDVPGNSTLSRIKENETNCPIIMINDEIIPELQTTLSERSSKTPNGTSINPHLMNRMVESSPAILCGIRFPRIKDLISFEPIKNPIFLAYWVSSIINKQVHLSYVLYLPIIASNIDCQNEIPLLLAIVASGEFLASYCASFVSQRKWVPIRYLYILVSFVNSLSCLVLLFSDEFLPLAVASASLGVGMGVTVSIDPLLLVEHVSADLLTHSYALVLLLTGVFGMIMFPIQGWTLDATNSFHALGVILSVSALIPALLWILVSIVLRKAQIYGHYRIYGH